MGNAKYMAAAMLNKEVHEESALNANRMLNNKTEELKIISAEVYPNPANDKVYFLLGSSNKFVITIFDVNGKKIFEDTTEKNLYEFNCKLLANGLYKFNVTQNGKLYKSGNFVVTH